MSSQPPASGVGEAAAQEVVAPTIPPVATESIVSPAPAALSQQPLTDAHVMEPQSSQHIPNVVDNHSSPLSSPSVVTAAEVLVTPSTNPIEQSQPQQAVEKVHALQATESIANDNITHTATSDAPTSSPTSSSQVPSIPLSTPQPVESEGSAPVQESVSITSSPVAPASSLTDTTQSSPLDESPFVAPRVFDVSAPALGLNIPMESPAASPPYAVPAHPPALHILHSQEAPEVLMSPLALPTPVVGRPDAFAYSGNPSVSPSESPVPSPAAPATETIQLVPIQESSSNAPLPASTDSAVAPTVEEHRPALTIKSDTLTLASASPPLTMSPENHSLPSSADASQPPPPTLTKESTLHLALSTPHEFGLPSPVQPKLEKADTVNLSTELASPKVLSIPTETNPTASVAPSLETIPDATESATEATPTTTAAPSGFGGAAAAFSAAQATPAPSQPQPVQSPRAQPPTESQLPLQPTVTATENQPAVKVVPSPTAAATSTTPIAATPLSPKSTPSAITSPRMSSTTLNTSNSSGNLLVLPAAGAVASPTGSGSHSPRKSFSFANSASNSRRNTGNPDLLNTITALNQGSPLQIPSTLLPLSPTSASRSVPTIEKDKAVDQLVSELDQLDDPNAPTNKGGYAKTLRSDLSSAEALDLFKNLHNLTDSFADFDEKELTTLTEVFSVLRVQKGEKIITKGECASFCGIILDGKFAAIVSDNYQVQLDAGNLIGEMALFSGGDGLIRNADVIVKEDSVLAVVTFEELDSLSSAENMDYITIQMKLLKLFAMVSIKKLKAMIPAFNTAVKAPLARQASSDAAANAVPPPSMVKRVSVSHARMSSTTQPPPVVAAAPDATRESLYRVRLALEKDKDAAQKAAEEEKAARLKIEKKNMNAVASLERYKLLTAKFKDALSKETERADALQQDLNASYEKNVFLQRQMREYETDRLQVLGRVTQEENRMKEEQREMEKQMEKFKAGYEAQIRDMREQLGNLTSEQADLSLSYTTMQTNLSEAKSNLYQKEQELLSYTKENGGKLSMLAHELDELTIAKKNSDEQLKNTMGLNSQLQLQLQSVRTSLKSEEEKASSVLVLKAKIQEMHTQLQNDKQKFLWIIGGLKEKCRSQATAKNRYKQLLKYVSVSCFMKLFRLKKCTRALHLQISSLLVDILEGHVLATATQTGMISMEGPGMTQNEHMELIAGGNSKENAQVILRKNLQRKKRVYLESVLKKTTGTGPAHTTPLTLWNHVSKEFTVSSGNSSPHMSSRGESAEPSTHQEAAAARASHAASPYHHGLHHRDHRSDRDRERNQVPAMKMDELLQSLEDEVDKLKQPFDEVQANIVHWKQTSEAFHKRNIELTSIILGLKKKLAAVQLQHQTLQTVLQKHNQEYEQVLQANGSLKLEIARYQNEVNAWKTSVKTLEQSTDIVGAKKQEFVELESRIQLARSQLAYVQQRYIETVDALNSVVDTTNNSTMVGSSSKRDLSPPRGAPHFPPPPPHIATSQSMASMLSKSSSNMTRTASTDSMTPSRGTSIAASITTDPLREELALNEFEKWKRAQFVLENEDEFKNLDATGTSVAGSASSRKINMANKSQKLKFNDPILQALASSTQDLASLGIKNSYNSAIPPEDVETYAQQERARAQGALGLPVDPEEESKTSLLTMPLRRMREAKQEMASQVSTSSFGTLPKLEQKRDYAKTYGIGGNPVANNNQAASTRSLHPTGQGTESDPKLARTASSSSLYSSSSTGGLVRMNPSSYAHPFSVNAPTSSAPDRNSYRSLVQYQSATSLHFTKKNASGQDGSQGNNILSPKTKKHQEQLSVDYGSSPAASTVRMFPHPPVAPASDNMPMPFLLNPLMMNNVAQQMYWSQAQQRASQLAMQQAQAASIAPSQSVVNALSGGTDTSLHPSGAQTAR